MVAGIRHLIALADDLLGYWTLIAFLAASGRWAGMFGHGFCEAF